MRLSFRLTLFSLALISAGCQSSRSSLTSSTESPASTIPFAKNVAAPVSPIDQASATSQPLAAIPAVPAAEEYEPTATVALPSPAL